MKLTRLPNSEGLTLPMHLTDGAAGFDLQSSRDEIIAPGDRCIVPTGFAWEIPRGYVGMVCPRSGLAATYGVTVLNAPGIVDSDYRGEVGVLLVNLSSIPQQIKRGDRIAQMVIAPALHGISVQEVDELSTTQRGDGGFGSTGA